MSLSEQRKRNGANMVDIGGQSAPGHFGDLGAEYKSATDAVGLHDRCYRGAIEITGGDRSAWLHNLVTNDIKSAQPGSGLYAFALDIKGRILFDCNVLVLSDSLLLDLDRRWVKQAIEHSGKYIIMEDVTLTDRSDDWARFALVGPKAMDVAATLCDLDTNSMVQLQHSTISVKEADWRLVRHDFAGTQALELFLPAEKQREAWEFLLRAGSTCGIAPMGIDALQILRVESGLPWSLEDIDEHTLPAETRQLERAVSFQKGCYLGQEVVERMRAHKALGRLLVGLVFDAADIHAGAILKHDGQTAGRVTSAVDSIKLNRRIGLGYVKTALAQPGTALTAGTEAGEVPCQVSELPFAVHDKPTR